MVDCGIMDTDSHPDPDVDPQILAKTDVLFLTHCHKDHTAAYNDFVKLGFHGITAATRMTLQLAGIRPQQTCLLDFDHYPAEVSIDSLRVRCGRSGHCAGGLWLEIRDPAGTLFFSGDYQEDTLYYAVDPVRDLRAQLAVVDCAHADEMRNAAQLRESLCAVVREAVSQGRDVIFPVPHYGRGCEIMTLLQSCFPDVTMYWNSRLEEDCALFEHERIWQKDHPAIRTLHWHPEGHGFFLLGGPHLADPADQKFVQKKVKEGALVILTGRLKKGSFAASLYEKKEAVRCIYPHHQSRMDAMNLVQKNRFDIVLPFHNDEKETWFADDH